MKNDTMRASAAAGLVIALFLGCAAATDFRGRFVEGSGDSDFLQLLDISRRMWAADYVYQSVPMLYSGQWDGLLEGIGWGAWWTQNSYGPTMCSLPFMDNVVWRGTRQAMAWWFNSIGDGTKSDSKFGTSRALLYP